MPSALNWKPPKPANSASKNALLCSSISSGFGKRTAHWRGACAPPSLKERGVIEDVDYQHPRGLDRKLVRTLSTSEWVRQHQSILLLGPTGIGKSWLACALAQKACRDGFSVLHKRTSELFRELAVAHADGSIGRFLLRSSLASTSCCWTTSPWPH